MPFAAAPGKCKSMPKPGETTLIQFGKTDFACSSSGRTNLSKA
jgi:hypothetical protein